MLYNMQSVLYFFFAYLTGADPFLGSIIPFFFGYAGKNWRHNQLCCSFWRGQAGLYNKGGT